MPDFLFKRGGDPATGIGNHADSAKMAGTLEPLRQMFHRRRRIEHLDQAIVIEPSRPSAHKKRPGRFPGLKA
ncbi:hypothetical protein NKH89_24050 [Mesorhizobium sp. M0923]|uniref:hypothetical protein n=1 Tax=unclassified Mesorhizobium TaxID=325217 RepID=UPI00333CF184